MPFESSISAYRWPGQSPGTSEGVLGSDSHAERIGQPPRRVDGDHAGAPAGPGRRQRDGGRDGGLADAARTAAHHDGPLGHELGQWSPGGSSAPGLARAVRSVPWRSRRPLGHERRHRVRQRGGQHLGLGRPDGRGVERRAPGDGAAAGPGVVARSARSRRRGGPAGSAGLPPARPGGRAPRSGRPPSPPRPPGRSSPTGSGSQALTMTGPSWTPALSSSV